MVKKLSFVMSLVAACIFTANAATVTGTVTNATGGAAIAGATVTLTRVTMGGGGASVTTTTDAQGVYTFSNVTATTYPANFSVSAVAAGFIASAPAFVRVNSASSSVTSDIELAVKTAGVSISGTVSVAGGNTGISGAKVYLRTTGMNSVIIDSAVSAANGTYSIDSVQTGTYSMLVSATGYTSVTRNNVAVTNAAVTQNFSLSTVAFDTVRGTVTIQGSSTAIAGAKVVLTQISGRITLRVDSTVTAANGTYVFPTVGTGTYGLIVTATGYNQYSTTGQNAIDVNGNTVVRNVSLTAVSYDTVNGTVTIQGTRTPISGAKVVLIQGTTRVDSATTDTSGLYVMPNIPNGQYSITVSATGYTTYTSTFANPVIVNGSTVTRNVSLTALPQPTTILGMVSNATTSAAIVGAKVVLVQGTARLDSTTSLTGGVYSFANVAAGTYSTVTTMNGFQTRTTNNIVVNGSSVTSNITLIPITYDSIIGQVRIQGTTTGIAGATLILMTGTGAAVDTVTSGTSGAYAFTNVASGTYAIITSAAGYATATTNVTVSGPTTQNIPLTALALGYSALGLVTDDADASALVGAKVVLQVRAGGTWTSIDSTVTVAGGLYVIDSIQVGGTYRLVASMTGYTSSTQNIVATTNGGTVTANFSLTETVVGVMSGSAAANRALSIAVTSGRIVLSNLKSNGVISLYSANGKIVFRSAVSAQTNSVALPSGLAAGSYLVNINHKNSAFNRQIMLP